MQDNPQDLKGEEKVVLLDGLRRDVERKRVSDNDIPKDMESAGRYLLSSAALMAATIQLSAIVFVGYVTITQYVTEGIKPTMMAAVPLVSVAMCFGLVTSIRTLSGRDGRKIEDLLDLRLAISSAVQVINGGLMQLGMAILVAGLLLNNSTLAILAAATLLGDMIWYVLSKRLPLA